MDQVIFREGKPGNAAYVVQEGKVEVFKTLNGDEEVILGTIEAGGLFGELALVDNKPRMASARATERTVLIAINRQTFEKRWRDRTVSSRRSCESCLATTGRWYGVPPLPRPNLKNTAFRSTIRTAYQPAM